MNEHTDFNTLHPRETGSGRFAERGRSESSGVLVSGLSDSGSQRGSFLIPPRPSTVGHHVQFWREVPVPDEVCERIRSEYKRCWNKVTTPLYDKAMAAINARERWYDHNPEPDDKTSEEWAAWDERETAYLWSHKDEARAEYNHLPREIDPWDAADIARADRMYTEAVRAKEHGIFSDEDVQRIAGTLMPLSGEMVTVAHIREKYMMDETWTYANGEHREFAEIRDSLKNLAADMDQLFRMVSDARDAAVTAKRLSYEAMVAAEESIEQTRRSERNQYKFHTMSVTPRRKWGKILDS